MTTERLVEIRARLKTQWIDYQSAHDISWLMAENVRLRAVLAGLPEPVTLVGGDELYCLACHVFTPLPWENGWPQLMEAEHAPDCPWLAVLAVLAERETP